MSTITLLLAAISISSNCLTNIFAHEVVQNSTSDDGGLKFRFTDRGIRYALELGEKIVNEKLQRTKLPAIRLDIDVGPGKGQATVRKLLISDYRAPTYKYQPLPPSGIQWSSLEGSITLKGIWSAWYKYLFKVSVDGMFIATVQNLSISTVLEVTRLPDDGRPQIKVPNCRASVQAIRLKFAGGPLPKVMNFLRGALEEAIEKTIKKQFCKQIQNTLVDKANAKIRSLPPQIKLNNEKPFILDYTLTKDPLVTEQFVEASINGTISYENASSSHLSMAPLPGIQNNDRMVYIWLSEYVPQSLFNVIHEQKLVKFQLDKEKFPQYAKFLRTTCPSATCIGSFKEELSEQYPKKYLVIDLATADPPRVMFNSHKNDIGVALKVDMYVEKKEPDALIMSFLIVINASITPFFKNNKLSGNVSVDNLDLQVSYSTVGNISGFEIYLVSEYVKPALEKRINEHLSTGFPIPLYKDVELANPKIVSLEKALRVEADFAYYPTAEQSIHPIR